MITKNKYSEIKFYILIILGFVIMIIGLVSPPLGVINNTVLLGAGQFLVLAGGLVGCVVHFDFKNLYFHIGKMTKDTASEDNKRIRENPTEPIE